MDEDQIKAVFREFATPMASFVALGAGKEPVEQIARNLWAALLGGPDAEQQVWTAMYETDSELVGTLRQCYETEMKPRVTADQLATLRARYGIATGGDEDPKATSHP